MKIFISFLFVLFACSVFAQSKGELGIYTEGGLYMPGESTVIPSNSNGFAVGGGIYYSRPMFNKFEASLGVGYRYKENQGKKWSPYFDQLPGDYFNAYGGYGYSPYGYSPYNCQPRIISPEDYVLTQQKITVPQKNVVVPLKLKYFIEKPFFIETGLEAAWLLKADLVSTQPDLSWSLGIGYKKQDLQVSLSYVQGFSEKYMSVPTSGYAYTSQTVKNKLLMLNLSYPLW